MKRAMFVACLLLALAACDKSSSTTTLGSVQGSSGSVAGHSYQVYVPPTVDPSTPAALVIAMHGTGGHGSNELARWKSLADSHGFIVLAPNYVDNGTYFDQSGNDAIFAMLAELETTHNIDRRRRYVAGYSTGGTWSFTFGIEHSQYFAAGAVFSGGYTGANAWFIQQFAARPIAYYQSHGINDGVLPYANAQNAHDARVAAGHLATLVQHNNGHGVPGNAAADAWQFMSAHVLASTPTK